MQKTNPGGTLAPSEVIGRDKLVTQLWDTLERQSLYITAERRMGKTSVVRDKMAKSPPIGWKLIYIDVSKAVTPLQFVEALLNASLDYLTSTKQAKFIVFGLLNKLAGFDIKAGIGIKLPEKLGPDWKTVLSAVMCDLANSDKRIVIAFDELPLMLDAFKRREGGTGGEQIVMEMLDTLRASRQENTALRMIYTGSLGLHHVLTSLRDQGYQNDPINDMKLVDLEPLAPIDAQELARRLLQGEKVSCDNLNDVATHLALVTDGFPYYIQHIVAEFGERAEAGTPLSIDNCLRRRLVDPLDPWQLDYYDERIDTHYPEAFRPIARAVLDQLAFGQTKSLEELSEGLNPKIIDRNRDIVRKVLRLLGHDHYVRFEDGEYRFRSPLIMRIWRSRRGMVD